MRMLTVPDSQNVEAVGYDTAARTLRVMFKGGRTYDYSQVSAERFAALVSAPSIGEYHARNIRGTYDCLRVPSDVDADPPPIG